jgi:membrane protein implicated in regulation of membrane protease activity
MNKTLINFFLLLLAIALVVFGLVFYVLLKLPLIVYLLLLSISALVFSVLAWRECRIYANFERNNYDNYKKLRKRIEALEEQQHE